jgi:hypothetical protein
MNHEESSSSSVKRAISGSTIITTTALDKIADKFRGQKMGDTRLNKYPIDSRRAIEARLILTPAPAGPAIWRRCFQKKLESTHGTIFWVVTSAAFLPPSCLRDFELFREE